jgi:hypothetical protein
MTQSRWTDAFLDHLAAQSDDAADACVAALAANGSINQMSEIFKRIDHNIQVLPGDLPDPFRRFLEETATLPSDIDFPRLHRAEVISTKHYIDLALALLTKSLPEGYAAPNLAIILNISGDLRIHPYKRLMSTLQTVVDVSTCGGFQATGRAVITAQKLRLMHASVRTLTRKYRPTFEATHGIPVNLEDMLGTVVGFSFLVLEGMRIMDVGLTPLEEEECFYLWRIFALKMGIHPQGEEFNMAYIPDSIDDARLFYDAYKRRHYVAADVNPDGVALAQANLKMMQDLVPSLLAKLGMRKLPQMYMNELMGPEMCARIGIAEVPFAAILKIFFSALHYVFNSIKSEIKVVDNNYGLATHRFGMILFQGLINMSEGGRVEFTIPTSLNDLHNMAE